MARKEHTKDVSKRKTARLKISKATLRDLTAGDAPVKGGMACGPTQPTYCFQKTC